ncbi:MAG: NAD-glutamate dehydrogenase [Spirochaetales bacterium]
MSGSQKHKRIRRSIREAAREEDDARFAGQFFAGVAEEDLSERDPANLVGAACAFASFARQRSSDEMKVRAYNPLGKTHGWHSKHTVVEVITSDMPFLVDSVAMAINRRGYKIHLTVHPVFQVERTPKGRLRGVVSLSESGSPNGETTNDAAGSPRRRGHRIERESWQQLEIDRETDDAALEALCEDLRSVLSDVNVAVTDWKDMRSQAHRIRLELERNPPPAAGSDVDEITSFLDWMENNQFTFLGYREYDLHVSEDERAILHPRSGTGLGILRSDRAGDSQRVLPKESLPLVRSSDLLIITKANSIATVHRPSYLDYVAVKTFDRVGTVTGERRFLGLFTSRAYSHSPRSVPILRKKVDAVLRKSNIPPESHSGKSLLHVLETYPRDELFQSTVEELLSTATGIVKLQERQRIKLFVRRDAFGRFFSCLVYVPRDRYNTSVRNAIEHVLMRELDGVNTESSVALDESILARIHIIVRVSPAGGERAARGRAGERSESATGSPPSSSGVNIDRIKLDALEAKIADAVRSWADHLRAALDSRYDEHEAKLLFTRYAEGFSAAYREDISPTDAVNDIVRMEELNGGEDIRLSLYSAGTQQPSSVDSSEAETFPGRLRFKIFRPGMHMAISDILPILENMGLRVIAERPYQVHAADGRLIWIQDVDMQMAAGLVADIETVGVQFQDLFEAVWDGRSENDHFNRLVLEAGLERREIMLLRAYCRYLLQTGLPFSQRYMATTLAVNPAITRRLVAMFEARFNPEYGGRREVDTKEHADAIRKALEDVASLDADRILRAFSAAIRATLRTNYYRTPVSALRTGDAGVPVARRASGAPGRPDEEPAGESSGSRLDSVALKFDSLRVPELPLPRPRFEVFVYSPKFEAVHLRGGPVARGGLRWSDRREDFRTEVLGLMKAQEVKNTLIVPVGAKGGFVVKQTLPADRGEQVRIARGCYADFLRGMLDVTDNLVDGAAVTPERVVRHDSHDYYLVVAADKGTATFSDLANSVAAEYDFWLGDAFASGGSVGYDHKKMGITALGAWESVKRHFREIGLDYRSTPFTAVGIGDMAGDVFGNGMLASDRIRLIAAFNHQHIFIDPDPDPEASYAERKRLFDTPGSSWADYDGELISAGGGVFARAAKNINLTKKAAVSIGAEPGNYTPAALIAAILRAPVDLLWNGGIGTYVKASGERHREVGDRANDSVRVNGSDLRARVVGEGGNLGFTQAGRVEFARGGGKINSDFIDNSGGVDCSDREVNIKILLSDLRAKKKLSAKRRDALFLEMTDEVGFQVLRDNYLQAQAISFAEAQGQVRLNEYSSLIRTLERRRELNRGLEVLPGEDEIAERRKAGGGLTRPELAMLTAHAKNDIYASLVASDISQDSYLGGELAAYFPEPLRAKYASDMEYHKLRDEIICTSITNSMVNRMGPSFSQRMCDDTGASHADVARAYTAARRVFAIREIWEAIEAGDHEIPADCQMRMLVRIATLLRNATRWLLNRSHRRLAIADAVERFADGIGRLRERIEDLLPEDERSALEADVSELVGRGAPESLARFVAASGYLYSGLDLVQITRTDGAISGDIDTAASAYFNLARYIPLEWLRGQIESLPVEGHWQSIARGTLREDYFRYRSRLAAAVLETGGDCDRWVEQNRSRVDPAVRIIRDMQSVGQLDFATVSVALQELRKLASQ